MYRTNTLLFATPFVFTLWLLQGGISVFFTYFFPYSGSIFSHYYSCFPLLLFWCEIYSPLIISGSTLFLSALLTVALCLKIDQDSVNLILSAYKKLIFVSYVSLLMGMFLIPFPFLYLVCLAVFLITLVFILIRALHCLLFAPRKKYRLTLYGILLAFSSLTWILMFSLYLAGE